LITCGDHLAGSAKFDEYAIRVNSAGKHALADCPEVALPTTRIAAGTYTTRTNNKEDAFWNSISTVVRTVRTLVQQSCDGVPFGGGSEDRSEESGTANGSLEADFSGIKISPNPFTLTTTLTYSLPSEQPVDIQIFNAVGNLVAQPVQQALQAAGEHEETFEASNLPAGVYFLVMQTGGQKVTKRLVITR